MSKEDEYTPQLGGFQVRDWQKTAEYATHMREEQSELINELKPKADKLDSLNSAQRTGAMTTNKANHDINRQLLEPYWPIYRKAIDERRHHKRISDVIKALEAHGKHVPARNTIERHMELIDQEKL